MSSNYDSNSTFLAYGMSAVNCTTYPPLQANPDVSGIGVLVSFLASAYLTLSCCISKYILDRRKTTITMARWSFILESMIMSFSDQQLITGISIVIGGLSQLEWGLAVYHFQEVGNLAWFSTMTHILTLTVLREKIRLEKRLAMKFLRISMMGCLVVMLVCVMAPVGYLTSAYGYWGSDDPVFGSIPLEFPAWCLFHGSSEWKDEIGKPMIHTAPYGYNTTYIVLSVGLIVYGYTFRVILLFSGSMARFLLRIPPGQPWILLESAWSKLTGCDDLRLVAIQHTPTFLGKVKRLLYLFIYSLYILILSGTQFYSSRIWELTWLSMALIWGSIRMFCIRHEVVSNILSPDTLLPSEIQNAGVMWQQNIWGFGQVVALALLALPFISLLDAYFSFSENESLPSQEISTPVGVSSSMYRFPGASKPTTSLQKDMYDKKWYGKIILLWYLESLTIGAFSLSILAANGGSALTGIALLAGLVSASVQIVPGATITTAGTNQHMQAHGGGIVEVSGTYYLIGENKLGGSSFQSVNCYLSTDLVSWTFVNKILTLQPSGDLGPNRVVERPHVMYNDKTGKWVLYMGDRWESSNLMTSTYVWLPLTISGTKATLTNEVNWILDIAAGAWSTGPGETSFEGEDSSNKVTGGAKQLSCSVCSNTADLGYVGGPSPGGTLTFPNISSTVATTTTIRIKYINGDKTQRYANVLVNGVAYVVAFLPTTGSTPGTSTLTVPLKTGSGNVVEFEAYNNGWGPDIDRLMVPVS
ncbi:hypothetical protein EG329_005890 [Mollisiaceae sp. DMI_Dod_QoI]|nr:hypothetical protein EG329_005890 [Helotiales sp. DMI_Dod_QoI]